MLVDYGNEFDVHTMLKLRAALDSGGEQLPIIRQLGNEDDIMRIAH